MVPAVYTPAFVVTSKPIEQNHLTLAFPGLDYNSPKRFALQLLSSILGGGVSSRLFQQVRERQGLCYTIYSYGAGHADTGVFCIYTAPMSLSIVGYLAVADAPNALFVGVMMVLAQVLFLVVLSRLPRLLRLKFYPSYAAMTFPFVITATALGQGTAFFRANGVALPFAFDVVFYVEVALATVMVAYVLAHYLRFFFRRIEQPQSVAVLKENAQIARFSENFDN